MSDDPAGDIVAALMPLLRADARVIAAFPGGKVRLYDMAPEASAAALAPYLVLGLMHLVDEPYEHLTVGVAEWAIHAWSRPDPRATAEAGAILGAVRRCLLSLAPRDVPLAGWVLTQIRWIDTQLLEDPDGMSIHGVGRVELSYDPA